ncbi:MAG: hypothetical protein ACK5HP_03155 [Bacilli bacterium]
MTYIESIKNSELKEYFKLLSTNYPNFIDKYIDTKEMQRLNGIGQFCGCDYTKLHSCKYWYSRLDHSIACALMTWHFTKNKEQTLGALFHDLGTPAFSHCIDYLLNDFINQESSERSIKEVILSSKELMNYLNEDNIDIDSVADISKYTIVENKKPKICVDRLEGVIGTGLVWCHFWEISNIKEIYDNITILINEENEQEIGFNNVDIANKFFEGVFKYSMVLQQNEDKLTMQFIADTLKQLIDSNIIKLDMLYNLSEQQVIEIIKSNDLPSEKWVMFENTNTLFRTEEEPKNKYYVSVDCKKRYVVPLVKHYNKTIRLNDVSKSCENLLNEYLNYSDSKYAYIDL